MIPGPHGEFAGVITATLDPKYFDPLLDSVRYAPDMAASLHHGDGIVFVHAPHEQDAVIGRSLDQPGSFFRRQRVSGQAASVFSGKLLATGEERMIAQRNVQPPELKMDKPLGVAVSRRLDDIYAPWRHDFQTKATWFALRGCENIASPTFDSKRWVPYPLPCRNKSNVRHSDVPRNAK